MQAFVIEGARVILPGSVESVSVRVEAGVIAGLDVARDGAVVIDGRSHLLAPALVDIHGDAFERQLMPRPNVHFPTEAALLETDRQLAANGIATAYHALTLGWEPGLRSVDMAREVIAALAALAPRLTVENRVQLRWETFCFEALPLIETALAGPLAPSIAFNDHTTMAMRAFDMAVTKLPFELAEADIAPLSDERMKARTAGNAKRAGLSSDDYIALLAQIWARRAQVAGVSGLVAEMGRVAGVPMLSHDDSQPEMRRHFSELGAKIAEFPMCEVTAREAKARGEWVVLGAPNVVRGGSHIGSLDAAEMISAGICDILASDYYYPALLAAVARLHAEARAPLPELWARIDANPAMASGLHDRGLIAPGKRADLVLLDWPEGHLPGPRYTWVAGRAAYAARSSGTAPIPV